MFWIMLFCYNFVNLNNIVILVINKTMHYFYKRSLEFVHTCQDYDYLSRLMWSGHESYYV